MGRKPMGRKNRERAAGNKEDARVLNHFLDAMVTKINQFKMDLMYTEKSISAQRIIDFVLGRVSSRAMLLDEFRAHNAEMFALVPREYAMATYSRYETTLSHVSEFIKAKYRTDDIEFQDLDHDFIVSYPERSMFRESYYYYVDGIGKHTNSTGWGLLQFDVLAHFHPFNRMEWIAPRPLLRIAGTEADTRHFSEDAVKKAGASAELFDIEGASHMDLYYKDEFVNKAVDKLTVFFNENL